MPTTAAAALAWPRSQEGTAPRRSQQMPLSISPWPLRQISLPSHGRGNDGPFKCPPKVTRTAPAEVTGGQPNTCPCRPSHTRRMGSSHALLFTREHWRLSQAILQALLGGIQA